MVDLIFLTGVTGLVGGNLAVSLLKTRPDSRLVLLVRAQSEDDARLRVYSRLQQADPEMRPALFDERLQIVTGDVTDPGLWAPGSTLDTLSQQITHVIHCAASVSFQQTLEEARRVNCDGALRVMEFARSAMRSGRLQRVAYVGTAFVSGDREGTILEEDLQHNQKFSNAYEQSKYEAEIAVRRLYPDLPLTILRPSIIVGDSASGRTTAFNVLYSPLRMIHHGMLKVLPGSRRVPLDIVPVDFVVRAMMHILFGRNEGVGLTYHLTAGSAAASSLGEVTDLAIGYFNQQTSGPAIPRLTFIPWGVFHAIRRLLGRHARKAIGALMLYEPYLSVCRVFDTSNTRAALEGTGISPPPFQDYYREILGFCLQTNWGKRIPRTGFHP
jgi:nucleoside-diphosphate-sugar epimerase